MYQSWLLLVVVVVVVVGLVVGAAVIENIAGGFLLAEFVWDAYV